MPRTAEEQNVVTTTFCDTTTHEERFDPDRWGNTSALASFQKFVAMGQENDKIWARRPHVIKVHIFMPDDPAGVLDATEEFRCPCSGKKVLAGAGA